MKMEKTDCDKCYGKKNKDCLDNCLVSHIRYVAKGTRGLV